MRHDDEASIILNEADDEVSSNFKTDYVLQVNVSRF